LRHLILANQFPPGIGRSHLRQYNGSLSPLLASKFFVIVNRHFRQKPMCPLKHGAFHIEVESRILSKAPFSLLRAIEVRVGRPEPIAKKAKFFPKVDSRFYSVRIKFETESYV
jgi:hypothetical protein